MYEQKRGAAISQACAIDRGSQRLARIDWVQHQSFRLCTGGFEWWLIWPIAVLGLLLFGAIAGFVYVGVGLGADEELDDEDEHEGETGLLEI